MIVKIYYTLEIKNECSYMENSLTIAPLRSL